jgi:hypothetical protein
MKGNVSPSQYDSAKITSQNDVQVEKIQKRLDIECILPSQRIVKCVNLLQMSDILCCCSPTGHYMYVTTTCKVIRKK